MMKNPSIILDLHMHSTVSDGTDSPRELVHRIRSGGICIFSLTDHDALEGCVQVREILCREKSDPPLDFINGVEFSCKDEKGKYHILGYGYDEGNEAVREAADRAHHYRMEKVRGRIRFLEEEYGFTFSEKDLALLYARPNPGKPHIGNLMVDYGYAPDKNRAITDYINHYKSTAGYLSPEEAILAILAGGGVPVLAHPYFGDGTQKIFGEDMIKRLDRLTDMGLMGVEAFYSGFSPEMSRDMLTLAEDFDLFVTAGSDYHGSIKKGILPGQTGLDPEKELPERMKAFLKKVT